MTLLFDPQPSLDDVGIIMFHPSNATWVVAAEVFSCLAHPVRNLSRHPTVQTSLPNAYKSFDSKYDKLDPNLYPPDFLLADSYLCHTQATVSS